MTVKRIFKSRKPTVFNPALKTRTLKVLRKNYTPNEKVIVYVTRFGTEAIVVANHGLISAYLEYKNLGYFNTIADAKKAIIKKEYGE